MNLSQLAESDARREEAQLRVRHHAALIAGIVCRIWQGRTQGGVRFMYHIRTTSYQLVCTWYEPDPKIRICRYLCTRATSPPKKRTEDLLMKLLQKNKIKNNLNTELTEMAVFTPSRVTNYQINCKKEYYRLSSTCGAPRNHTNVQPVDAHV